jgi:hypothetical protein
MGPQTCFDIDYRACLGDRVGAESSAAAAFHVCVCLRDFECSGTNASSKRVEFTGYDATDWNGIGCSVSYHLGYVCVGNSGRSSLFWSLGYQYVVLVVCFCGRC